MEAVLKPKSSQGKKKTKKSKYKNSDGKVQECSYQTLPQDVESLQLSGEEDDLHSTLESVSAIESAISDAFNDICDESIRLLNSEGKEHLDLEVRGQQSCWKDQDKKQEDAAVSCLQTSDSVYSQVESAETELDEIQSPTTIEAEHLEAVTNFESPLHLPSSPSVEAVEDPTGLWMDSGEETLEVANEASPSAPTQTAALGSDVTVICPEPVQTDKPFFPFVKMSEDIEEPVRPFTLRQLSGLYRNAELDASESFVEQFVESELRGGQVARHPLYELLANYQRARAKLTVDNVQLNAIRRECDEHQDQLWTLHKCVVTERGECQDGNPVEAAHEFQTACYNKSASSSLSRCLCSVRDLIAESFALNAYTCEILKMQVESFVQELCGRMPLPHDSPVSLEAEGAASQEVRALATDLCPAVSVLFAFQRRPVRDEEFVGETRCWLTRLVAVLLRIASWREHLFLLHHVLRCPAGVGAWAACFVQPPAAPHSAPLHPPFLDHLVACLASVLLPITARDHFLSQMVEGELGASADDASPWVLVDSEGEDEEDVNGLRESDVVALLNQVPFDAIFRQALLMTQRDDRNVYNKELVTDQQVLKLMSFCSLVIGLLEQGLRNHGAARYHQYAKRLGRLVRHTAQYATDQWLLYRSSGGGGGGGMSARLSVEYDQLLGRAVSALYHGPGRACWQFLAVLPFGATSTRHLWALFHFLLTADDQPVGENEWSMRVSEQLASLSDAEVYYLLTAVNTMALSRSADDWPFIRATTLQLLEIGFLTPLIRDNCYKSARIMLANLTTKYPPLLTEILHRLNTSSNCGKLCLLLVKELPLSLWTPTDADLTILSRWLLQSGITTFRHGLARYIISGLNLGYSTDDLSHELFLPRSVHVRVAMLVLQAAALYCPQNPPEGTTISDTVKQMASLTSLMSRPGSSEQAVTVWVWQTAYRLRLHLMDQSDASVRHTLASPGVGLSAVPDMDADSQEVELITKHLKTHQAMAVYMCLQCTALGHSVPLVCGRGFALLSVLQSCQMHTAVVALLQHLVPLFLDCPDALVQSDKFRSAVLALLSADRTFFKAADFPGHILQQFGDMIHCQLENYSRYNVTCSTPLAQLWLQSLCTVWSEEPTSASYLMDVVLSCAFFRPDITAMAYDNLGQLLQTLISTTQAASSRLSSLFSWVSGSAAPSLVPAPSCPHAPWFALFALHVEELRAQGNNGLWREIVKELATAGGKPSVDAALKRAAVTVKVPAVASSALSIYRWSQQALDTSVDHPVAPLLWQRFFLLYFTRHVSATGVDHGSVGHRLFAGGAALQSHHKRLKRKLNDCVDYFRTKATSEEQQQALHPDRHLLHDTLAKLYETFSLWLDEPRLHEPGLYLPALPPQYNPAKLSVITSSGEQSPWYEYVDYEGVRRAQNGAVERWQRTQGRDKPTHVQARPNVSADELGDPVNRIDKRLHSYDSAVPPPPLRPCPPVVPPLRRDTLLRPAALMAALKPSLEALVEYAQSHCLRVSEHTALDCTLMELLPTLYTHVETEVTLKAACDVADPRSRPSAPLNCAGPAVIHIKIRPACVNFGVRCRAEANRREMDGLVKRSLQRPPSAVSAASVHVELVTRALDRECAELRRIGDVGLLGPLAEGGVTLFYHMSGLCTDEALAYAPLKQLLTTSVETLGNVFISGQEGQCVRLISSVLHSPSLSGLLAPHFTPSVASPSTFLQMYCTLVEARHTTPDLLFVLLSKFDISQWLNDRKPKLAERSQIIELAGKALATAGTAPPQEILMLHGVYRHHLATLFNYDFPQHYGEVLALALRHSQAQALAPDCWFDLVNALAAAHCRPGLSLGQLKEAIHKYATEQRALSLQELRDTATMLGSHFTSERLQYGLYGLYPKYRMYIEPLTIFHGMIGHALVVATLQNDRGTLADKLCSEQLWPGLCGMFSPWLAPYFTHHLTEPTAAWIQQLTDDRSVLPPWIVADGGHAHNMAAMFVECIRFVLDTLPAASSGVLSCVWQFYVSHYAHCSVKDHVLSVVHGSLMSLPWNRFCPSLHDIEQMLKLVDQYLPNCHTFLGAVFIEVGWLQWARVTASVQPPATTARITAALLHLLVKLANEPNVRQSAVVTPLLLECQQLPWHLVDCGAYESVVNWFVMSYDPRVVLQLTGDTWSNTDMAALDLLEVAAGFSTKVAQFHSSTLRKRQLYVRACAKLLLNSVSRHKQLVTNNADEIRATVRRVVDKIERVVTASACVSGPQRASEAGLLLTEVLSLVNQPAASLVPPLALDALLAWLSAHGGSVAVSALLLVLGITVADCDALAQLLEASLTAYFRRSGVSDSSVASWSTAVSTLQPVVPRHPPLEETLVAGGRLLSLYALSLKHTPASLDVREEAHLLNNVNQWLANIKISDESVESKLALLWSQGLHLGARQCEYSSDPTAGPLTLRRLALSAGAAAEQRGWAILGAIGLSRTHTPSNRCRLLSRFVVALILAQLPDSRNNTGAETGSQFVRTKPHAPGAITASNGDYVASADALKALHALESLSSDKSFSELRTTAEFAARLVRQPEHSVHDAQQLVMDVARQLYTDSFLHARRPIDKPTPV